MGKAFFVEQELSKRGIGPEWSYTGTDASPVDEEDLFLYEYTDEEHSDDDPPSNKKSRAGTPAKDALRIQWEREFAQKYQQYMKPEQPLSKYAEQYLLEDLFVLLRNLNKKWVEIKAARYRRLFFSVDEEIPLQIGCAFAYEKLVEDKQNGLYLEHALAHYLRVAQNKTIDLYFRKEFGRLPKKKKNADEDAPAPDQPVNRKVPQVLSLEGMHTTAEGQYQPDRDPAFSYDPFANMERPRWERNERSHRLAVLYLNKLMDYPYEPQKPLAVMYGSCLFQLAKMMENEDRLTQIAKASTALSSKEWAFMKMGSRTLRELGDESERIVSEYYGPALSWGNQFVEHMSERTDDGSGFKWADIVYTSTYTKDQTSNWIESVSKSAIIKAAREIADQPDMIEYVMETLGEKNRFRKALESAAKEERK